MHFKETADRQTDSRYDTSTDNNERSRTNISRQADVTEELTQTVVQSVHLANDRPTTVV